MPQNSVALYRSPAAAVGALAVTGFGRQVVTHQIIDRRLPVHAVVLVENGRGSLRTQRAGLQAVTGPALFWLMAGSAHSYGPAEGESWDERWALFDGSLVADFIRLRLISDMAPLVQLNNLGDFERLFAMLHADMADDNGLSLASAAAVLHRIAVQSARQAEVQHRATPDALFDKVIKALQARALVSIDFGSFAEEFSMSPATLRRRFVAATGLPPKAFQLRLRISRAKELLTLSALPIEEIAAAVGFEDAFYFSRLFRDREACSPSAFRDQHRRG